MKKIAFSVGFCNAHNAHSASVIIIVNRTLDYAFTADIDQLQICKKSVYLWYYYASVGGALEAYGSRLVCVCV